MFEGDGIEVLLVGASGVLLWFDFLESESMSIIHSDPFLFTEVGVLVVL